MSEKNDTKSDETKSYDPNIWGLGAGFSLLVVFAVTHFTIGFPDLFVHVLIIPVVIGFMIRFFCKLDSTNRYRND